MLSDRTIRNLMSKGDIIVDYRMSNSPYQFQDHQIQPVSVDLRLGDLMRLEQDSPVFGFGLSDYFLKPQEFILGSTAEWVGLSGNLVGQVHGKSTRARQGLIVHAAGLVDPGFKGNLTLEMFNMSSEVIPLSRGMLICQISFEFLSSYPDRVYGDPALHSHYQGQTGPTPAR